MSKFKIGDQVIGNNSVFKYKQTVSVIFTVDDNQTALNPGYVRLNNVYLGEAVYDERAFDYLGHTTTQFKNPFLHTYKQALASDQLIEGLTILKKPICECGKEKHGFANHVYWCDIPN